VFGLGEVEGGGEWPLEKLRPNAFFFFKTADYSAFTDGIKVRLNPGADQTQFLTEFEPPNPLRTKQ